jgi:hypothetical protein
MLAKVFTMKQELYNGRYHYWTKDQRNAANEILNKVLDAIDEYSH